MYGDGIENQVEANAELLDGVLRPVQAQLDEIENKFRTIQRVLQGMASRGISDENITISQSIQNITVTPDHPTIKTYGLSESHIAKSVAVGLRTLTRKAYTWKASDPIAEYIGISIQSVDADQNITCYLTGEISTNNRELENEKNVYVDSTGSLTHTPTGAWNRVGVARNNGKVLLSPPSSFGPGFFTSLKITDTDLTNLLELKWNEDDDTDRTFNFKVNGGSRTLDMSADLTVTGASFINQDVSTTATPTWEGVSAKSTNPYLRLQDTALTMDDWSAVNPFVDTNTIGLLSVFSNFAGTRMRGFASEGAGVGTPLKLEGYHGGVTPSTPAVRIGGYHHNGTTGATALSGIDKVLGVGGGDATLMAILADGTVSTNTINNYTGGPGGTISIEASISTIYDFDMNANNIIAVDDIQVTSISERIGSAGILMNHDVGIGTAPVAGKRLVLSDTSPCRVKLISTVNDDNVGLEMSAESANGTTHIGGMFYDSQNVANDSFFGISANNSTFGLQVTFDDMVGIGIARPSDLLHVDGGSIRISNATVPILKLVRGANVWQVKQDAGEQFVISDTTAGADRFIIDTSGGISIPGALSVAGGILTDDISELTGGSKVKFGSDIQLDTGLIFLAETSTPTAVPNYGALYTKDVNELFFQDGAGVEHLLHGDSFSNIWFHNASTVEVTISTQGILTKIDSFTVVGKEDDLANAVGSTASNEIAISAIGGGEFEISYHTSMTATGGADKEMMLALGIELATPLDITNVTDDTVTPIVITSVAHGLENGDMVEIVGVLVNTAANGSFIVDSKTDDTFVIVSLDGSATTGNGDYNEGAPTGDVTIEYPGNMVVHREVRGATLGALSNTGLHDIAHGDKLAIYVANLDGTTNLTVAAISFDCFRIGD